EGSRAVEGDGRLHEVGAQRRAEVRAGTGVRAASGGSRGDGAQGSREGQGVVKKDLGFRLATGAFGVLLILIVAAIGFELARQSLLSIQKFGFDFWRTSTWDPVSGEFGALPFIWGTLYSSILALALATPISIGIAIFISELSPARLRQ